jgi:uncharacterized OsmC-like protein
MSAGVEVSVHLVGLVGTSTHGPSGSKIKTTPPADNGGDGSSFSPTDLLATALATCALTTMALTAARERLPWGDASAKVVKIMSGAPRRVETLVVSFTMPKGLRLEDRAKFEAIASTCPVSRSLHPDVKVPMTFEYP